MKKTEEIVTLTNFYSDYLSNSFLIMQNSPEVMETAQFFKILKIVNRERKVDKNFLNYSSFIYCRASMITRKMKLEGHEK